jgi:hypothetical protein
MNSSEFDRRFDAGDAVLDVLDLDAATRPRLQQKRVNVDFPLWMVEQLDREATRLGVTRQSIIKVWLAERLEHRTESNLGTATVHCQATLKTEPLPTSKTEPPLGCCGVSLSE